MNNKVKKLVQDNWSEVLSVIGSLLGIISTIIAVITEGKDFVTICAIVIGSELVICGMGIYSNRIKKDYEKRNVELQDKLSICEKEKRSFQIEYEKMQKEKDEVVKNNLAAIMGSMKNMSKLNNDFCNRIPRLTDESYYVLSKIRNGEVKEEVSEEVIKHAYNTFAESLFELYKRYSTSLLECVVKAEESYLTVKGYGYRISATIKLFDNFYYSKEDKRDGINVYTAFRDKDTYDKHEREIGEILYTISENSDFVMCLRKEQFIINNAKKGSDSYINEHVDFDKYYNCAIVVPIRTKLLDNTFKIMGYLCCDCINDIRDEEIFDKEAAKLLFSFAQHYASFLETMESNWHERVSDMANPQDFVNIIFQKTYIGNKK